MSSSKHSRSTNRACNRSKRTKLKKHEENKTNKSIFSSFVLMVTLILYHTLAGFCLKTPHIHRVRKDLEKDIFLPLGDKFFQRSYHMKKTFYILQEVLREGLEHHFLPKNGGKRNCHQYPYCIKTEIRLSIALRYFAGSCPYNLIVTHSVSYTSVFYSIWGVVNITNKNPI
jgi:hypothetical protein